MSMSLPGYDEWLEEPFYCEEAIKPDLTYEGDNEDE